MRDIQFNRICAERVENCVEMFGKSIINMYQIDKSRIYIRSLPFIALTLWPLLSANKQTYGRGGARVWYARRVRTPQPHSNTRPVSACIVLQCVKRHVPHQTVYIALRSYQQQQQISTTIRY